MMEFDLVKNALHSLREAMFYYNEADEKENADKYKFCVLLTCHCAELLLKEILRRQHQVLIYENIDQVRDIKQDDEMQTVGYKLAIQRVKRLCGVDLKQYENYLNEIGKIRNQIQHYKCNIEGVYYKNLIAESFSAIEYLFLEVLNLRFDDFEDVIDSGDVSFLHEDVHAYNVRKKDIVSEFKNGTATKFVQHYDVDKEMIPLCPICGSALLAEVNESGIHCKMCGNDFDDYIDLCKKDDSCINSSHILRELGKRRGKLYNKIYSCRSCDCEAVVYNPRMKNWNCLCCGRIYEESAHCDECSCDMPADISQIAISDEDTEDYKTLCPDCVVKARNSVEYIGYYID